jgi:hypothetical protein
VLQTLVLVTVVQTVSVDLPTLEEHSVVV